MAIHIYAETEMIGQTAWHPASPYLWRVLTDDDFAAGTNHGDAAKMMSRIAYSAIDDGERPFGDTGIRALYDDANNLGAALKAGTDSVIEDLATDISKVFVHFAGQLALNDVETLGDGDTDNDAVLSGVLKYDATSGLEINLEDSKWYAAMNGAWNHKRSETANPLLEKALAPYDGLDDLLIKMGDGMGIYGKFPSANFDRIVFATSNNIAVTEFESSNTTQTLIIGQSDAGTTILGSLDTELILGGAGNDHLNGGGGKNYLYGGAGIDTADYSMNSAPVVIAGAGRGRELELSLRHLAGMGNHSKDL